MEFKALGNLIIRVIWYFEVFFGKVYKKKPGMGKRLSFRHFPRKYEILSNYFEKPPRKVPK
jgi:hypothetical protein